MIGRVTGMDLTCCLRMNHGKKRLDCNVKSIATNQVTLAPSQLITNLFDLLPIKIKSCLVFKSYSNSRNVSEEVAMSFLTTTRDQNNTIS